MVSVQPLLPLMPKSEIDYKAPGASGLGSIIRALIDGGFVRQVPSVESYPVVAGTFEGRDTCINGHNPVPTDPPELLAFVLRNQDTTCVIMPLTLILQPVPNSNRLSGTSKGPGRLDTASPIYEATVTPNDYLVLRCAGSLGTSGTFSYIEREGRAYLLSWNYLYSGIASGKRTEVKTYAYSFLPELRAEQGYVSAGQFQVGEISELRLTLETRATANFAWRVLLDPLGKTLLGVLRPTGVGTAEFAKKPDGTWVLAAPLQLPPPAQIGFNGD
jgi:hypothetical protein